MGGLFFEVYDLKYFDMKKVSMSFIALSILFAIFSCGGMGDENKDSVDSAKAVNKENKPVDKEVSDFAINAANGGMMEVSLGRIAQQQAVNPRVKDFGTMMIKDHSDANESLRRLAVALQIALPDSVSNADRKEIDRLSQKKGKDFDNSYMAMMLEDHKKDVAEFRRAADKLTDTTIKTFAATTLPVLEKHLDSVKSILGEK
jgi:putative membrane protein